MLACSVSFSPLHFALLILLIFILKPKWIGIALISSYALEGVIVQVLKQYVFTNHLRPWKELLNANINIHVIEGLSPFSNNSFPSGHTTAIVTFTFLLALIHPQKKYLSLVLALCAILISFSRIYLAQHWPEDVLFGITIGLTCASLNWYVFMKKLIV